MSNPKGTYERKLTAARGLIRGALDQIEMAAGYDIWSGIEYYLGQLDAAKGILASILEVEVLGEE